MIKRDAKLANRHPHLRKKHIVGSDSIDRMDTIGGFHHAGPYDATLLARNISSVNSPVDAVTTTNEEALRATPREMIQDSVEKHRPLDGVAMVPPGMEDRYGNVYNYTEGTDMMIENSPEGGAYKRWPGVVRSPPSIHPSHMSLKPLHPKITITSHSNTTPPTSKARASPPIPSRKPSSNTNRTPDTHPTVPTPSK